MKKQNQLGPTSSNKYPANKSNSYVSKLPAFNINSSNQIYGYMNTGKNDDRRYVGIVKRKVYMKNANGEELRFEENHLFCNGNKNSHLFVQEGGNNRYDNKRSKTRRYNK